MHEKISPSEVAKINIYSSSKVKTSTMYFAFVGPENTNAKESVAASALMEIIGNGKHARLNKKL